MPCERTLISELHLHLQSLELFGDIGLGLRSHLLAGPLLDPVELLVDIHLGGSLKLDDELVLCL
jgi:hypothetical protein